MRLIDANALAKFIDYGHLNNPDEKLYSENDIREMIDMMPTIDAVPSETLYDFIREIGAITYGKERFFYEDVGVWHDLWYDRKSCDYITTQKAIEECLKAVRELDDGDIDAEPVKSGMWTFIRLTDKNYGHKAKECSSCGSTFFDTKQWNYCPNCGADMRGK